jgi:hypothetical protein
MFINNGMPSLAQGRGHHGKKKKKRHHPKGTPMFLLMDSLLDARMNSGNCIPSLVRERIWTEIRGGLLVAIAFMAAT